MNGADVPDVQFGEVFETIAITRSDTVYIFYFSRLWLVSALRPDPGSSQGSAKVFQ